MKPRFISFLHHKLLNSAVAVGLSSVSLLLPLCSSDAQDNVPAPSVPSPAEESAPRMQPVADESVELDEDGAKMLVSFMYALSLLKTHYVDPGKVTYKKMFQSALRGVMQDLDRFSNFESQESYESVVRDFSGHFGGIGVLLSTENSILEVVSVDENGAAAKSGVKPGDVIVKIDGKSLEKMKLSDCSSMIRGEIGTLVTITVRRPGEKELLDIRIIRGIVANPSVASPHIIPGTDGIGYVMVKQFAHDTSKLMDEALQKLTGDGMKSLIIDLRNNPGGIVEVATDVCSRFLPKDQLVVTLEWRDPSKNVSFKTSDDCKKYETLPLMILVNHNSASASELVSSALRDYKRAVILGERTFGKGSAQNVMPIGDLGALRMTIAHYFTPSHTEIHGKGLNPDITVEIPQDQYAFLMNQLNTDPGVILPEIPDAVRDIQLERAIEVLRSASILSGQGASDNDK